MPDELIGLAVRSRQRVERVPDAMRELLGIQQLIDDPLEGAPGVLLRRVRERVEGSGLPPIAAQLVQEQSLHDGDHPRTEGGSRRESIPAQVNLQEGLLE
jgi:hypothetical protein